VPVHPARHDGIGLVNGRRPGPPQLRAEAILGGAPAALDAALGLGAGGPDPGDPRVVEGPPDLGRAALAGELLGEWRRPVGVLDEDAVQVGVQRHRQAVPGDGLGEDG
jgi:hypothetical protein